MGMMKKGFRRILAMLIGGCIALQTGCASVPAGGECEVSSTFSCQAAERSELSDVSFDESTPSEESLPNSSVSISSISEPISSVVSEKSSSAVSAPSSKSSSSSKNTSSANSRPQQSKPISGQTKAVWISQFDLSYALSSGGKQRNKAEFTGLAQQMMENLKGLGWNTVFIQARPYSDSFYPSAFFPWSKFVTGSYGKEADYDPYEILVTQARKAGFSVHGWINPMRGMTEQELPQVANKFPIKKWYLDPQKKKTHIGLSNGRWYYNPAEPEVRRLIADGAKELLKQYRLDGIHIDDYFYESQMTAAFDQIQYQAYQKTGGKLNLLAWRRENVSLLVKELYQAVKSVDPNAQFGISPAGNIQNNYGYLCADVKKWCREKGYIDYICPQIYFGFEHAVCPFEETLAEWNSLITTESGVYLLAGLSLGKAGLADAGAKDGAAEWQTHSDVLKRSMQAAEKQSKFKGYVLFCYQYLFDPQTGKTPDRTKKEIENFAPLLKR